MVKCLAFIPLDKVMERFIWIKKCFHQSVFEQFIMYLERTWFSGSPYPPSLRNQHDVIHRYTDEIVKISNTACESFNSDLIRRVKGAHINMCTLIQVMQHIEHSRLREFRFEDAACNIRTQYKARRGMLSKKLRETRHLERILKNKGDLEKMCRQKPPDPVSYFNKYVDNEDRVKKKKCRNTSEGNSIPRVSNRWI